MSNFVDNLKDVLNEKTMQISLIGGVLFFILSQPGTYDFVQKTVSSLGKSAGFTIPLQGNNLIILHAVVFSLLLSLSTNYMLEPLFYGKSK